MANYKYMRIHSFMLLLDIGWSENVNENAEPYSNQNQTFLPALDSDYQGEHIACIWLLKFNCIHFPHQIYATCKDCISGYWMTEKWDIGYWHELIWSIAVTSEGSLVKENVFCYIPTRKTFIYISTLHFCILPYQAKNWSQPPLH